MLLKLATMSSGARIDRFCTRVPPSIYTRPLYPTKLLARVHDTHGSASQCVAHQPAHLSPARMRLTSPVARSRTKTATIAKIWAPREHNDGGDDVEYMDVDTCALLRDEESTGQAEETGWPDRLPCLVSITDDCSPCARRSYCTRPTIGATAASHY